MSWQTNSGRMVSSGCGVCFHPVRPENFSKEGSALLFRKVTQAARVTERKLGFTSGQPTFPVKGQPINISGFAGHLVFASTHACYCSTKTATDSHK